MDSPSQRIFETGLVSVGRFRCRPSHPHFHDTGPTRGHLLVFPRETVTITHTGKRPIVADPSCVMLYNRGQEYRREAVTPAGDRAEWFAVPGALVHESVRAHAPRAAGNPERPFGDLAWAPGSARGYALARALYKHVLAPRPDPLLVEEVILDVLDETVAAACGVRPARRAQHVDLADAARRLLAARLEEPLSLRELARALSVSPFHLARVFRATVGRSLHAWRTQVRLRVALERVLDGADLMTVALDAGFSSHSHFTQAFHAAFGAAPSKVRSLPAAALSKILTA